MILDATGNHCIPHSECDKCDKSSGFVSFYESDCFFESRKCENQGKNLDCDSDNKYLKCACDYGLRMVYIAERAVCVPIIVAYNNCDLHVPYIT